MLFRAARLRLSQERFPWKHDKVRKNGASENKDRYSCEIVNRIVRCDSQCLGLGNKGSQRRATRESLMRSSSVRAIQPFAAIWRHVALSLLGLAIAAALGACSTSPVVTHVTMHADPPPEPYVIGKDDVLNITVWREPQLSGKVRVGPDGTITVPLVGVVPAADRSCAQLQAELQERLGKFTSAPNVTVSVADPRSRVFYALGEVKKPGIYPLHSDEMLSQGLAQAGGLTDFADESDVRILRHYATKDVELIVNYKLIQNGKNLSADIPLEPGDTLTAH